ncbi:hypothetical protein HDU93_004051, partial [Gonapodya sp. JEL0774]
MVTIPAELLDVTSSRSGKRSDYDESEHSAKLARKLWDGKLPEVSVEKVSKWLTLGTPSRNAVLSQYFRFFEISHLRIDDALRCVCLRIALFELESQAIDRIIQAFASRYFESNPDQQGLLKSE